MSAGAEAEHPLTGQCRGNTTKAHRSVRLPCDPLGTKSTQKDFANKTVLNVTFVTLQLCF